MTKKAEKGVLVAWFGIVVCGPIFDNLYTYMYLPICVQISDLCVCW